jgi:uncharacterized membrane protein
MDGSRLQLRLAWLLAYLALVLPLALVLATIVPLGQVADEPAHALRAGSVAQGHLVGHRGPLPAGDAWVVISGMDSDAGLARVMSLFAQREKATAEAASKATEIGWDHKPTFFQTASVASYFPVFYLPAAAVLAVAQHNHIRPVAALLAARLANVMVATLLGGLALLTSRRGYALLFGVLAVPMTVSLTASLNPDGLLITASALAAALLARQNSSDRPNFSFAGAALLLLFVGLTKPPLIPLAGLLLAPLPPVRDWMRVRGPLSLRLSTMALVVLLVAVWSAYVSTHIVSAIPREPYEAGPLWPGERPAIFHAVDPSAQAVVVAAHPLRVVALVWQALLSESNVRAAEMIGVLGWLNIILPHRLYWLWGAAAVVAVADLVSRRADDAPPALPWLDFALLLAAGGLTVTAICLAQYLNWTPVGATGLQGVQGRYFLPLCPMLAVVMPRFRVSLERLVRAASVLLPTIAAAAGLLAIPHVIVDFYYLR